MLPQATLAVLTMESVLAGSPALTGEKAPTSLVGLSALSASRQSYRDFGQLFSAAVSSTSPSLGDDPATGAPDTLGDAAEWQIKFGISLLFP